MMKNTTNFIFILTLPRYTDTGWVGDCGLGGFQLLHIGADKEDECEENICTRMFKYKGSSCDWWTL